MDIRHSAPETVRGNPFDTGACARAIKECRRREHRLRSGMDDGEAPGSVGIGAVRREAFRMALAQRLLAGGHPVYDTLVGNSLTVGGFGTGYLTVCLGNPCTGCNHEPPALVVREPMIGPSRLGACDSGYLSVSRDLIWSAPRLCGLAAVALGAMGSETARLVRLAALSAAAAEKRPGRRHHSLLRLLAECPEAVREGLMAMAEGNGKD